MATKNKWKQENNDLTKSTTKLPMKRSSVTWPSILTQSPFTVMNLFHRCDLISFLLISSAVAYPACTTCCDPPGWKPPARVGWTDSVEADGGKH